MPQAATAVRRTPRPRFDARRDEILDTAVRAFRRKGFDGTSMRDIGRALERTQGSLYYYFPDKEEILYRCHERALDRVLTMARGVLRRGADPAERLGGLIQGHVALMVEEFQGTGLALEVSALRGRRLAAVIRRRDRYERLVRRVLREGIARGAFRAVDPKLTAFSIFGSINWIARWYRPRGGAGAADIGRAFADLYLWALRSDPDSQPADRPASGRRP